MAQKNAFYIPEIQSDYVDYVAAQDMAVKQNLDPSHIHLPKLPLNKAKEIAAYGVTPGDEPIFGPVNWDQFYPNWMFVGQDYRLKKSFFSFKPLIDKHMQFLKDKGFVFRKVIGSGGFGEVWRVTANKLKKSTIRDQPVNYPIDLACKIIRISNFRDKPLKEAVEDMIIESEMHMGLDHNNIVAHVEVHKLLDEFSWFPQPIVTCIFMELCNGSLHRKINKKLFGGLSERKTHQWFVDIIPALKYLHDNNIAHLDIKPMNILYVKDSRGHKTFKLSDFGLSLKINDENQGWISGHYGTHGYIPPEMQNGCPMKTCDIYSLGISLAESLFGFNAKVIEKLRQNILDPPQLDRIANKSNLNYIAVYLAQTMLRPLNVNRPTVETIMRDDWFVLQF